MVNSLFASTAAFFCTAAAGPAFAGRGRRQRLPRAIGGAPSKRHFLATHFTTSCATTCRLLRSEFKRGPRLYQGDVWQLGMITALSYGLSKFLMGSVSDRSDPRRFMAVGLVLTACCNFAFGASTSYNVHFWLWGLNGFFQGMGWPPCGRVMGHWFSESERGLTFSIWNTSHNVGGGIAGILAAWSVQTFGGWQYRVLSSQVSLACDWGGVLICPHPRHAAVCRPATHRRVSQRFPERRHARRPN